MRSVAMGLVLGSLLACSAPAEGPWGVPAAAPVSSKPVAAMQTRDYRVLWLAGGRMRVEDRTGAVVAEGPARDVLAQLDPFLRAACTSGTAGVYLDASLHLAPRLSQSEEWANGRH